MSDVTFFMTSCKRHDLLKITLESFEQYNTYPISRGIIIEDSPIDISWAKNILKSIPNLEIINTAGRRGQIRNIDQCYSTIDTPYVFHCEDDIRFTRSGFIESSKSILDYMPTCINVWLMGYEKVWEDPSKGYKHLPPDYREHNINGVKCYNMNNIIHGEGGLGFTFQPSLHRMDDWRKIGSYENLLTQYAPWANLFDGGQTERNIARYYVEAGYRTMMLAGPDDLNGYYTDIGSGRHVPFPTKEEL
jgi:hypothetical protein